jgi:uncharacterized coiled-coil DUF342 family protein
MNDIKENFQELAAELRQTRDELRVKISLAKAEVRDEWEELEEKWEHFRARAKPVEDAVGESAGEIGDALVSLGQELKRGYQRIRDAL